MTFNCLSDRKRRCFVSFFYILCIFVFTGPVWADMVFLKDGRIIESTKITKAGSDALEIESKGDRQTIPKSEIIRFLYNEDTIEKVNILFTDGRLIQAYVVEQNTKTMLIRREKFDPNEELIQKAGIKQMSSKKIVLYYPEISVSGGLYNPITTGSTELSA